VTDPEHPELLRFLDGPPNTWTIQVQVADGTMITALEHLPPGLMIGDPQAEPKDGFLIWDVHEPDRPKLLGQWASGAAGTHRNFYNGGQRVYATSTLPGFEGHVLAIVDIADPANPRKPRPPEGLRRPELVREGGPVRAAQPAPAARPEPPGTQRPVRLHRLLQRRPADLRHQRPRDPRTVGYYIADDPQERRGPVPAKLVHQAQDVLVDRRGVIYMSEGNSGIYILTHQAS
jgi:hypothetical protein